MKDKEIANKNVIVLNFKAAIKSHPELTSQYQKVYVAMIQDTLDNLYNAWRIIEDKDGNFNWAKWSNEKCKP